MREKRSNGPMRLMLWHKRLKAQEHEKLHHPTFVVNIAYGLFHASTAVPLSSNALHAKRHLRPPAATSRPIWIILASFLNRP
jgi:hypothetical protein